MSLSTLPKIELHLHLDCSLSFPVVQRLAPGITRAEYEDSFIAPAHCTNLADYLKRATKGVDLMQTEEALRLVTLDLFDQLAADHVVYAEIRFAPLIHLTQGLRPEQVVEIVNQAVRAGKQKTGVEAGVILCTLRHFSAEESMATVRLVEQFLDREVVGFDIAGDEAGFPIDAHITAFQYARERNIPCTAHAGEARGADSVWETLRHFQPQRLGHGVRSIEDPHLIEHLKTGNIHLEVCPTSNVQTAIYPSLADHKVDQLYHSGLSLSINTDGRSVSNVNLQQEYQHLIDLFGWEKGHLLACNLAAIEHAFTTDAIKEKVRARLLVGYQ